MWPHIVLTYIKFKLTVDVIPHCVDLHRVQTNSWCDPTFPCCFSDWLIFPGVYELLIKELIDCVHISLCHRPSKAGWQPGRSQPEPVASDTPGSYLPVNVPHSSFEGMSRINDAVLEDLIGEKRQIGKGFAGFLTDAEYRFSRIDANIRQQMISLDDHR